jgi:N-acetylglucosaminyldiphosphoundecaprenol N-acetyl-beta-D-mannosaminyltransferase
MAQSSYPTIKLEDYSIYNCKLDQLDSDTQCIINTVNQYSYVIAEQDSQFKAALTSSDVLLPDGIGIVAAVKLLNNTNIKKIAGADLHEHFLNKLDADGGSCFYLGSSEVTLALIKKKISAQYPNIRVGFYSPPFKSSFSKKENDLMIEKVNEFAPDVLFVGMTAPKQEIWTYENKDRLHVATICAIGAVFDFYAGTVSRPAKFWRNLGLEWFIRLLREPKRMYKRYVVYGPAFVFMLLKLKLNRLFYKPIPQIL